METFNATTMVSEYTIVGMTMWIIPRGQEGDPPPLLKMEEPHLFKGALLLRESRAVPF